MIAPYLIFLSHSLSLFVCLLSLALSHTVSLLDSSFISFAMLPLFHLILLYYRHSAGERDAQNELNNRILVQRNSRKVIVEWKRVAQDLGDRSLQVTDEAVVLIAFL